MTLPGSGSVARPLLSHDAFERRFPDEAHAEEVYDNSRRAAHIRAHGSDDDYRPLREFPCSGSLRIVDEDSDGLLTVACDACPFDFTARAEHLKALELAPF